MSAGRVHEAAVTSVDEERRVVCVEWFEDGETKGKEVRKQAAILYIQHTEFSTLPFVSTPKQYFVGLYLELVCLWLSLHLPTLCTAWYMYSLMMDVHSRHIVIVFTLGRKACG